MAVHFLNKIIRTERIWQVPVNDISSMCHVAKNLYNEGNYIIRQKLFEIGDWIRYNNIEKMLHSSYNYKLLPAQSSQQVLKLLDKNWKSFFAAIKDWKKNPDKYLGQPKIPKYLPKDGEYILKLTNQQVEVKDGVIKFPKKLGSMEVKVRDKIKKLREVRIVPKGIGYWIEVVYELDKEIKNRPQDRIAGIDFGSTNIVSIANNIGVTPIIVKDDGTGIKSMNQFYNKQKAKLQYIYDKQHIKYGKKMNQLQQKHENKTHYYIHKLTKTIIDFCCQNDIGKIIVGKNLNWKQNINLGRKTNQTFGQIPHAKIIEQLNYKGEENGIVVVEQDEAHTSKCSFIDFESVEHHEEYVGKRVHRGLFRSKNNIYINADTNAAYNIIRKSEPNAFNQYAKGVGGCGVTPKKITIETTKNFLKVSRRL